MVSLFLIFRLESIYLPSQSGAARQDDDDDDDDLEFHIPFNII